MNKLIYLIIVLLAILTVACQSNNSTEVSNEPQVELVDEVQLQEESEVILLSDSDLEYSRSVAGLEGEISYDLFISDKNEILAIIEKLDESMQNRDYQLWRNYLTPSSISYWSNRMNLQILSTKLPGDAVVLRDLPQYFTHMFIPSRIGRIVTEIRYNSPTAVKAVQVEGDTDIIFYDFVKENGQWLVSLPRL